MPLSAHVAIRDYRGTDDELPDDDGNHRLPDVKAETQQTGRSRPSADVDAGQQPEADEGPGTPCAARGRKRNDVVVDPRTRLALILVSDFESLQQILPSAELHGWGRRRCRRQEDALAAVSRPRI